MRRWPRFMGCTRWGAPPAKTRISELGSVHHGAHARQGNVSRAREGAQFDPRVGPAYRTHAYAHTYIRTCPRLVQRALGIAPLCY